jgi:hypothetical protein
MNRAARLSINVAVFAAGAISTLVAQLPSSNMQINPVPTSQMATSPMSVTDMTTHMKGTMSNMQVVANSMQRSSEMHLLMDRMKSLGADLTLLLNRIQVLMSDKTLSQDQLKMQRAQNISRHVQNMIQSVDGVVAEMEQMQKGK